MTVSTDPSRPSPSPRPRVDSEVGRLRTVMLHRPGPELSRLTPRNNDRLLFDGIPWVERAQVEHDAFASALRSPTPPWVTTCGSCSASCCRTSTRSR